MTKLWLGIFNLISLFICISIFFVILPIPVWGAESNKYASDLIPPQITAISPLPDGVIDTAMPKIEVTFADTGSDIDENTIHLVLDRIDVTGRSVIERIDVTGQASNSPRKITYRPAISLTQGVHQLSFNVRDLAGNLAEFHWRFEVKAAAQGGFRIGGSNTYQFDATPILKNTDSWELNAQGQYGETGIQLRLLGRVTDYPDITPNFSYDGYNFYYDKYSLGLYRPNFSLVMGCATASLSSELLQIGVEVKGGVAGGTVDLPAGQYSWSAFSGKTGSSYGMSLNAYDITGFSGEWRSASGWGLGGYYAGIEDADGYSYGGIKGNMLLGGSILFRYELVQGYSRADGRSGNGMALHLDTSLASTAIGFDYFGLQPDYPEPGSASALILTGGGMQRYAVHSVTAVNSGQNINVDASVAVNNPEGDFTTRNNLSIGYNLTPNPDFNFSSNYQGDFQYNNGILNNRMDRILLSLRKTLEHSWFETSLSFGETRQPELSASSDQIQAFGAWTKPIGEYNLTPSVQWTHQYILNGIPSSAIDTRVTLDRQFHPELTRSKIALYYRKREDWNTSLPFQTKIGLETTVYMMLWHDSTLFLTGGYEKWINQKPGYTDEGWNMSFSLSWKMVF
jgi:hypothetical protein